MNIIPHANTLAALTSIECAKLLDAARDAVQLAVFVDETDKSALVAEIERKWTDYVERAV